MEIKVKRKQAGISQAKLAEVLGINQKAVSQWEAGSSLPTADKLPAIAAALGCSIDDLFGTGGK